MASGMEMLIKSFGLDPTEIKKNVEGMGQLVVKMAADQGEILKQISEVRIQNDKIISLLKDAKNER